MSLAYGYDHGTGAVPAEATPDLLMFVAGEPDSGVPHLRNTSLSIPARLLGTLLPYQLFFASQDRAAALNSQRDPTAPRPPPNWELPPGQIHCVNAVLETAERLSRKVTLIDVDRAGAPQELIDRWVGPNDVFPILVRPDGARLEGEENFDSPIIRRFLSDR